MAWFNWARGRSGGKFLLNLALDRVFLHSSTRKNSLIEQSLEHIKVLLISKHFCNVLSLQVCRICRRNFSLILRNSVFVVSRKVPGVV